MTTFKTTKTELRDQTYKTVVQKRKQKALGVSHTKELKDLYNENYKTMN
jgi:hypothetical protein